MKEPVIIKSNEKPQVNPNITHMLFVCDRRDKFETLRKIIASENPKKAIVFVNNNVLFLIYKVLKFDKLIKIARIKYNTLF